MSAVIVAVFVMLSLSLMRVNVILALFLGALAGGLTGGLSLEETLSAFGAGLGGWCQYCPELCTTRRLCHGHLPLGYSGDSG